jgi:thiol-disulfide isomerase/thioredoxin
MSNVKRRQAAREAAELKQRIAFSVILAAAAFAIIFSAVSGGGETSSQTSDLIATAALEKCPEVDSTLQPVENGFPSHTLDCLGENQTVDISKLRGPLVINVWGSWCPPCVEELPWLAEFHEAAAGKVKVLGVNVSDNQNSALQMLIDTNVKFASLYDPNSESRVTMPWSGTPVTFFVNEKGEIIYRHEGRLPDPDSLYEMVNVLFGVTVPNPRT